MTPQNYPRISDESNRQHGYLDDNGLAKHHKSISKHEMTVIVERAIEQANQKSGRKILNIPPDLSAEGLKKLYKKKGKELFNYFVKYCGDPASTAHNCHNKLYKEVAREQFKNWTLQKERMNSGWRYQYIAKDGALKSKRFKSVSDIGTAEADFNAVIELESSPNNQINIYVSVKNRVNTMGGQDWPKAIAALEEVAKKDKNRNGPYICVFGIAMEKGSRVIKTYAKTRAPISINTELWKSDYFWPFFTNHTFEYIVKSVLDVLIKTKASSDIDIDIPVEVLDSFRNECSKRNLLDPDGRFNDAYKLVEIFCGK